MCNRPVHVRNPRLDFDFIKDKFILDVPCGHCEACKQRRRNDWFVRAYYEWLQTCKTNGFVYYLTLTYKPQCLPKFRLSDGSYIPCFDKNHLQQYIKLLRTWVSRELGFDGWKFFVSSEYGGNSHRPHYHILFFVYGHSDSMFRFKGLARLAWKYGWTAPGKKNGGILEGSQPLKYCAKYVCKDVVTDNYFQSLIDQVSDISKFQNYLPFTRCSQHFGECALQLADRNLLELDGIKVIDNGVPKVFKLPRYLDLKLCYKKQYNINGNIQYVLSDYGEQVYSKRFYNKRKNLFDIVTSFLNDENLSLIKFNSYSYESFYSLTDIKKKFMNLCDNDLDKLVDYLLVYRGYSAKRVSSRDFDGIIPDCQEVYNNRLFRSRGSCYTQLDHNINFLTIYNNSLNSAYGLLLSYLKVINEADEIKRISDEEVYQTLRTYYSD